MIGARLAVAAATIVAGGGGDAPSARHDVHLTYTRMVVQDQIAVCRIRIFTDDLTRALRERFRRPDLRLAPTPEADSLFARYFNERFVVALDRTRLTGRVTASGEEKDMWWYEVRFDGPAPIHALALRNGLLFELFDDQRNLMKVLHAPSEEQFTFYFVKGDREPQTIRFAKPPS